MRYKIGRCNDNTCNNTDEPCERKVKILYCQKREHVALYGKGVHRAESKDRIPKHHGISETVKEKLEDLICNYDSRPLRLHVKLEKLKRKQKIEIDHMPTLKQIQDFVSNRRRKIVDYNNMEELKSLISKLSFKEEATEDHELFVFGAKLGDGSETDHFQLGKI
jgi:hypothetical protein